MSPSSLSFAYHAYTHTQVHMHTPKPVNGGYLRLAIISAIHKPYLHRHTHTQAYAQAHIQAYTHATDTIHTGQQGEKKHDEERHDESLERAKCGYLRE